MASEVTYYQLALSAEERLEVELTAEVCGVSVTEAMRLGLGFGLAKAREALAREKGRVTMVDPLPESEWERIYSRKEDDEGYALPELITTQVFPAA